MPQHFSGVIKGIPRRFDGYDAAVDILRQLVRQRDALIDDDWQKLEELANEGTGKAYGTYREMIRSIGVRYHLNQEANLVRANLLKSHAKDKKTRKEFFAEVKNRLLGMQADIPAAYLAAFDKLGKGKTSKNVWIQNGEEVDVEDRHMVASSIDAIVALASKSLVALTYANFQSHHKRMAKYPFEVHDAAWLKSIEALVEAFGSSLEAGTKHLYDSIRKAGAVVPACEALSGSIEAQLPEFGRIQATLRGYMTRLGEKPETHRLQVAAGKLSAKAGRLTRSAFAAHAASYYLALQSRAARRDAKANAALKPAAGLRFETKFPSGKVTEISRAGLARNGAYLELSGFVQKLSARKGGDGKLISYFTLHQPGKDATADVVGVFVQLRNMGLQEGAYCSVSGTWRRNSTLHRGKPALEAEKLRINELSRKSWTVLFHDLADKFVDRWPGSLNIAYGLSPHVSGGKEGQSEILGAGELIFRSFIR